MKRASVEFGSRRMITGALLLVLGGCASKLTSQDARPSSVPRATVETPEPCEPGGTPAPGSARCAIKLPKGFVLQDESTEAQLPGGITFSDTPTLPAKPCARIDQPGYFSFVAIKDDGNSAPVLAIDAQAVKAAAATDTCRNPDVVFVAGM